MMMSRSSFYSDVRPVVFGNSAILMAWGFLVRFGPKSAATQECGDPSAAEPFTYETIRKDLLLNFSATFGYRWREDGKRDG